MLANARVLGHVFDPRFSVFWCYDSDGVLVCVVAEVHNTYGERHAYLLRLDEAGFAVTDKDFHAVLPVLRGQRRLRTAVHPEAGPCLHDSDAATAGTPWRSARPSRAARNPRRTPALARRLIRQPLMPQRISALIRMHGIWLWLHRLPIRPRPHHTPQEGV